MGILIVAIVSVWLTVTFQHVTVYDKEDLRAISCGWPMPFITSNQEWRDPPYPYRIGCLSGEWGDLAVMQWRSFVLNLITFYLVFATALHLIRIIRLKRKFVATHL